MEARLTAIYRQSGDWWVASVAEIPGAHSQGRTLEEARENLRDAVELLLQTNRELAERGVSDEETVREELFIKTA
jgi:predicted RNase H-like HicB family nuclease